MGLAVLEDGVACVPVGVAVAVVEVGRSAAVVRAAPMVGSAALVGAGVAGAAAVLGEAVSCGLDESLAQAASKSSPAASDKSTTGEAGRIHSLLAIVGLPVYRLGLHAICPPRSLGVS